MSHPRYAETEVDQESPPSSPPCKTDRRRHEPHTPAELEADDRVDAEAEVRVRRLFLSPLPAQVGAKLTLFDLQVKQLFSGP